MFSNKNLQSIGENEGKIDSDSIMRPIQTEFLYFSTFTAETESFDNRIKRKLSDRVSHSQTKIVSTPDQMHALMQNTFYKTILQIGIYCR